MSGIQGYSLPSADETYVIFSVSPHNRERLENVLTRQNLGVKRVQGCYQGTREPAWIVSANTWRLLQAFCPDVFEDQESILVLGPQATLDRDRPATLVYFKYRLPEALGYFHETDREDAESREAFTYDPVDDIYYVCDHADHVTECEDADDE